MMKLFFLFRLTILKPILKRQLQDHLNIVTTHTSQLSYYSYYWWCTPLLLFLLHYCQLVAMSSSNGGDLLLDDLHNDYFGFMFIFLGFLY